MTKLIFLLKRKPGLTPAQFREHYETNHVRLAQKYIGHLLTGYVRNYPGFVLRDPSNLPADRAPTPFDLGYDVITEMHLRDDAAVEEMVRIFNDPQVRPILKADERQFLDDEATVMVRCDAVDTGTRLPESAPATP